jgi:GTP-binding protein
MPVVAIVGRPNVGKSSLLNALTGRRISIVQDMPGVTRDRVSIPLRLSDNTGNDRFVELVDTGGYGIVDVDQLTEHIHQQIELAMNRANLVLFVVDCQQGLTGGDQEIATLLRRQGLKVALVANKADGPRADVALGDFARLGFGTPIGVSALAERNLDQVFDAIRKNIDLSKAPTEMTPPQMMVAIVGKRNAGKSTLVNSIAESYEGDPNRVIVSEVPGTTRDSVDVRFEKDGKSLIVIDTAGVRKKRHMATNDIEFYSFHRAQRSIRRADVVLMLVDGTEPVSEPDKKLAQYIAGEFKPVVIVVNKWDLARERARELVNSGKKKDDGSVGIDDADLMEQYRAYLDAELKHLDYAPIAFITAKEGRNVQVVLDLAQRLFKQANEHIGTGRLNAAVRAILQQKLPSTPSGRKARVYYATQPDVAPPTIVLFVNKPEYLDEPYQRFMINRLRELLPYAEVPIRLVIRGREGRYGRVASLDENEEDSAKPEATAKAPARPAARTGAAKERRATSARSGRGRSPKRGKSRR